MAPIRSLLHGHGALVALLLALALAVRALVPAGMMLAQEGKRISVTVCADGLGEHRSLDLVVPMEQPPAGKKAPASDAPCPYGGLAMAGLPGADAALLAGALAYILLRSTAPSRIPALQPVDQLRPPLRGPPALS